MALVMQVPRTFELEEFRRLGRPFTVVEDRLGEELLSLTVLLPRQT